MTGNQPAPTRHWSPDNLDLMWATGSPASITTPGDPWCRIDIHPDPGLLVLITPFTGTQPDVARYAQLNTEVYVADGEDVLALTAHVTVGGPQSAYTLIASITDEIQLRGATAAQAVTDCLARHRDLLATRAALTTEHEVGLIGELLLLEHLMKRLGPRDAIDSWVGPLSEEHDFALPGIRVECKTTTGENRVHLFSSLTQAAPANDHDLYLLSTQVTRAGTGSGRTLPALVATLTQAAGDHRPHLDQRLRAAGWDSEDEDLYTTAWQLRTRPHCYLVDDLFPAITPQRLATVVPHPELIREVHYRVDISSLPASPAPEPLRGHR